MSDQLTYTTLRPAPALNGAESASAARDLHTALTTPSAWRHTLVLTGTLNAGTAPDLEEEVECLSQEGVTSIVLDLRRLQAIDPAGEEAIATLPALFKRQGPAIAVIGGAARAARGSLAVEDADTLAIERTEPSELALFAASRSTILPSRSTEMVKVL